MNVMIIKRKIRNNKVSHMDITYIGVSVKAVKEANMHSWLTSRSRKGSHTNVDTVL